MPTGNTDTKSMWELTRHIFRYNHIEARDTYNGAHTINEGRPIVPREPCSVLILAFSHACRGIRRDGKPILRTMDAQDLIQCTRSGSMRRLFSMQTRRIPSDELDAFQCCIKQYAYHHM